MSIYRYSGDSCVQEVAFHYAKDRPPVALLVAAQDAAFEQLLAIRKSLEAKGWQCVPAYAGGKEVLQVSGFKREAELDETLRSGKYIEGAPVISPQEGDNPQLTPKERLQRISLRIAGALNLVGDVGALVSGIKGDEKGPDYYWVAGGSLYTIGGLVALGYGNTPKEKFLREISEQTAGYLQNNTGGLVQGGTFEHVLAQRKTGPVAKLETYLRHHAADVMLGAYAAGAAPILAKGMANWRNKGDWKGDWSDAAYGGVSLAVKSASLLTPEKIKAGKEDQATPEEKGLKGFIRHPIRWFTEQPLRIFGGGSLVSELLLANRSYRKGKKGIYTWMAAGAYMLSDIFAMISKKDHVNAEGKLDADQQRSIEAAVAQEVAHKPETEREALAQNTGNFLASRREMKGKAGDISQSILEQAKHLRGNPWATRVNEEAAPPLNR